MTQHIIPPLIMRILTRIESRKEGAELADRIKKFFFDIFRGEKIERAAVNNIVQESEQILQNTLSPRRIAAFRKVIYGSFDRAVITTGTG